MARAFAGGSCSRGCEGASGRGGVGSGCRVMPTPIRQQSAGRRLMRRRLRGCGLTGLRALQAQPRAGPSLDTGKTLAREIEAGCASGFEPGGNQRMPIAGGRIALALPAADVEPVGRARHRLHAAAGDIPDRACAWRHRASARVRAAAHRAPQSKAAGRRHATRSAASFSSICSVSGRNTIGAWSPLAPGVP